jgi:signal transduction histidine kinase
MLKNRATRIWLLAGCFFYLFGGALTLLLIFYQRDAIRSRWEHECAELAGRVAGRLSAGEDLEEVAADLLGEGPPRLEVAGVRVRDGAGRVIATRGEVSGSADLHEVARLFAVEGESCDLLLRFDARVLDPALREATWLLVGLFVGLALIGLLAVSWMLRRWMAPIHELSGKMALVEEGNLDVVGEEREDEIGALARHFNGMVAGIRKAREQSLELARKQANIEKFAALGRLSAGVAHEINNPVGGILTCLETMKGLKPGSDRYQEYLKLVRSGLERIGKIVGQLLRFSRQGKGDRKPLDLNTVLEEVVVLSRFHNRDDRVKIVRQHHHVPAVLGAPDLLHQLFLNLVLNAMQEMPDGGTLTLNTWAENETVCVAVEDTGPGIPEELLDQIFEPFVTTKGVGVGTGLGLSVALGIVESHGGTIEARNRALGGARFLVRLPAAEVPKETRVPVMEKTQ